MLRIKHPRVFKKRVLIVCEGKKTEPNYLKEFVDKHKLHNVKIVGSGTTPSKVITCAMEKKNNEIELGEGFDEIFCVFDRDNHSDFESACQKAKQLNFTLIRSNPCFEYWLILHFIYSRKPFVSSGGRTPSKNCENHVNQQFKKNNLGEYKKNSNNTYSKLENYISTAIKNSKQSLSDAKKTKTFNPSTEFHKLIESIYDLIN